MVGVIEIVTEVPMKALKYGEKDIVVLKCDSINFEKCKQTDKLYYFVGSIV